MKRYGRVSAFLAGLLGLLTAGQVVADGFRNPPDTAAAIGQAGKCVAWVDDASAVFFNPANLVDLAARQALVSVTIGNGGAIYRGQAGKTDTDLPWFGLPANAIAWPLPDERLAVGLGVHVPFGRSSAWDRDGLFHYTAPVYARMMVLDITPALAWRVSDEVSVGAGLDIYYGRLHFREFLPPFFGDVAKAAADGWAFGANAGVTWRLAPGQRLALTCRAPFDLKFSGTLHIDNAQPPYVVPDSSLSTTFQFPMIVTLAYGVQVTDSLRLETDVEWLQYSRFGAMRVNGGANAFLLQAAGQANQPTEWNDTFTFGLGASWHFAPAWTLRAGCEYLQSPEPDRTFSPTILDNNQSLVCLGIGYKRGPHAVDLGIAHGIFGHRNVRGNQNPAYVGEYEFSAEVAALTYTFDF